MPPSYGAQNVVQLAVALKTAPMNTGPVASARSTTRASTGASGGQKMIAATSHTAKINRGPDMAGTVINMEA